MTNAVVTEQAIECQSEADALWIHVADTERLNRAVGLDRVSLEPMSDASAARYLVTTRLGGFPVKYEERPFEWVYPESFRVVRRMLKGPLESLEFGFHFAPRPGGGTTLTARLVQVPRYRILTPFLQLMGARSLRNFEQAALAIDAELVADARGDALARAGAPPIRTSRRGALHAEALRRAESALREREPGELAARIARYVREAPDADVARVRPFALADEWSVDRRAVLATCLASVRAGLLELQWEVVCPSCRIATEALPSLASLSEHATCQLCEIQFAVDLDEAVEVTFAPAKAVRDVDVGPYCIGGPARTPHVIAQAVLPPLGEALLRCPPDEGSYRLFVRGGLAAQVEIASDAPAEVHVGVAEIDATHAIRVAPAGTIAVANASSEERHAKLERVVWTDQAAKARVVMTMPGFRRDFSTDVLRPGMALKVTRVGLFFSDLTGSTQLYSDAGDAAAFKLVQDHFDVVVGLVEKKGGALVKTMGDAVMAAFADDLDGLVASIAILHAFDAFRREHAERQRTNIKLGVYGGACYAVTANGVLDYFGQTVNVAARLQAEAKSGELVVEAELADRAIAAKMLPESFVRERYTATLKGVPWAIEAARIRVGG